MNKKYTEFYKDENIKEILKQGTKHDQGKVRLELIPSDALEEIGKVLTFGAEKYNANNWRQGFNHTRLFGAILRHLHAWNRGEDIDPESGIAHLAHAGCGLMFLLEHHLKDLGNDDRFKYD